MDSRQKKIIAGGILAVVLTAGICGGTVALVSSRAGAPATALAAESEKGRETTAAPEETTEKSVPETTAAETSAASETAAESKEETAAETKAETDVDLTEIIVDKDPAMYTYEDMEHDMKLWEKAFPQLVKVNSLGKTYDGREIYDMVIGDINSANHIMINGGIHAREYMTSQLVMKQAAGFLQNPEQNAPYLENTALHVIPMINPDGIVISQFGPERLNNQETKDLIQVIAQLDGASDMTSYYRRWKSNAQGIDVNRNFDALWEDYNDHLGHPSADHYKGESVGCVPEAAALIQLTNQYNFVRTVSYHTQGGVIYWYFGQQGELKDKTESFAQEVSAVTGYPLDANYQNLDPAGYKDWCIHKKGIPSLTIEVGKDTSPVDPAQFAQIWNQNKDVWSVILNY